MNNKKRVVIVILAVVIAALLIGYFVFFKTSTSSSVWQPINLTPESLPLYLENFKPVQDIPNDGSINLVVGEEKYVITKGNVAKGHSDDADIMISVPQNYFEIMGQRGWCSGLHAAKENGDLDVKISRPPTAIAWKYKNLGKYRSCFG